MINSLIKRLICAGMILGTGCAYERLASSQLIVTPVLEASRYILRGEVVQKSCDDKDNYFLIKSSDGERIVKYSQNPKGNVPPKVLDALVGIGSQLEINFEESLTAAEMQSFPSNTFYTFSSMSAMRIGSH